MWHDFENLRRRAWCGAYKARADKAQADKARADQARREDSQYWSGPTSANGATNYRQWSKQWDREQKDNDDLDEYEKEQRAARREARREARKEARKEAQRKTHNTNTPPPEHPTHQGTENFTARAETEQSEKDLLAKLLLLLSKIIDIQVDSRKLGTEVDQSSKATKVHYSRLALSLRLLSGYLHISGLRERDSCLKRPLGSDHMYP